MCSTGSPRFDQVCRGVSTRSLPYTPLVGIAKDVDVDGRDKVPCALGDNDADGVLRMRLVERAHELGKLDGSDAGSDTD